MADATITQRVEAARKKGRDGLRAAVLSYRDYWDEDYPQLKWADEAIDRLIAFERAEAVWADHEHDESAGLQGCQVGLLAAIEEIERA